MRILVLGATGRLGLHVVRARNVLPDAAHLVTTDITDAADTTLDHAAKSGTRTVKVSGTSAGIGPAGPNAYRQHHDAEQHLADSGLAWSVIRPNGFMQTLVVAMARAIREKGVIARESHHLAEMLAMFRTGPPST